jgi:hypothetical protein
MGFFNILKKAFDPRTPFRQAKGIANAAKSGDWKGVLRGVNSAGIPMGLPGAERHRRDAVPRRAGCEEW